MSLLPPIRHPGPVATERCAAARAEAVALRFGIRTGESVEQGLARGLMRSYASELMIRAGRFDPRTDGDLAHPVRLDVAVVAMDGSVHEGILRPGENPVCVTFELVVVPESPPTPFHPPPSTGTP